MAANGYGPSAAAALLVANVTVLAMAGPSGAGSTWALTGWLAKSCPGNWTQGQVAIPVWSTAIQTTYKVRAFRTLHRKGSITPVAMRW
jgi:hypothetical protein